jgi:hypothetical protein
MRPQVVEEVPVAPQPKAAQRVVFPIVKLGHPTDPNYSFYESFTRTTANTETPSGRVLLSRTNASCKSPKIGPCDIAHGKPSIIGAFSSREKDYPQARFPGQTEAVQWRRPSPESHL